MDDNYVDPFSIDEYLDMDRDEDDEPYDLYDPDKPPPMPNECPCHDYEVVWDEEVRWAGVCIYCGQYRIFE
jgi:hypothetical protein